MLHIPSIPKSELRCAHYRVTLNGQPAPVWLARVSAVPLNRVWNGKTRPLDQTEPAGFCLFTMDEPVEVEIEPLIDPIESVEIRPFVFGIEPVVENGRIRFTMQKPQYLTLQLNDQHNALHLLPSAPHDYGVVPGENLRYYGPGVHEVGIVDLQSNETVYIDDGAVVYGAFRAANSEHIRILGRGVIDGSLLPRPDDVRIRWNQYGEEMRWFLGNFCGCCSFFRCKDVVIDGPVLRDPNMWTVVAHLSEEVHVRNVKLFGWRPNCDGVDFCNSKHCSLRDSFLRNYDDAVVIKGLTYCDKLQAARGEDADVDDILVEDCVVWCDWGHALELGIETAADRMRNITMRRCHVIKSSFSSIDVGCVFRALVSDILFEDCSVENDDINLPPVFQTSDDEKYSFTPSDFVPEMLTARVCEWVADTSGERGNLRNVTFRRITCRSKYQPACAVEGYDAGHTVEGVVFEDIVWNGQKLDTPEKLKLRINEFTNDIVVR